MEFKTCFRSDLAIFVNTVPDYKLKNIFRMFHFEGLMSGFALLVQKK